MRQASLIVALFMLFIPQASARDLDAAEKKLIIDAVTKDFKDAPAARFRWMPVTDLDKRDSQVYCGMVNGKNSYGAFTGFVPFSVFLVAKSDKVIVVGPLGVGSSGRSLEWAILKNCMDEGIDPRKAQ